MSAWHAAVIPQKVILSEVFASRSEANTQSKDPIPTEGSLLRGVGFAQSDYSDPSTPWDDSQSESSHATQEDKRIGTKKEKD
jgi:hypothetical protein